MLFAVSPLKGDSIREHFNAGCAEIHSFQTGFGLFALPYNTSIPQFSSKEQYFFKKVGLERLGVLAVRDFL